MVGGRPGQPQPARTIRIVARWSTLGRRGRRDPWPRNMRRADPVAPPTGWVTGPPDFVGIGVQKAGTSWWYELLAAHPGVQGPLDGVKERHFFAGHWDAELTADDRRRYARLFPRPPGCLAGEWTPRYMHDVWVPPLLVSAAPDARFLVLLRDPVERYRSGLAHDLARGAPRHPTVATDAFARGLYAAQLERVLQVVDPSRLLVLQYERCRADVRGELRRTQQFLGLEQSDPPADAERVVNPTSTRKPEIPAAVRSVLVEAYSADAARLVELIPSIDLTLWTSLG